MITLLIGKFSYYLYALLHSQLQCRWWWGISGVSEAWHHNWTCSAHGARQQSSTDSATTHLRPATGPRKLGPNEVLINAANKAPTRRAIICQRVADQSHALIDLPANLAGWMVAQSSREYNMLFAICIDSFMFDLELSIICTQCWCIFAQRQNSRGGLSARDPDECAHAGTRDIGGVCQLADLPRSSAHQAESHQHKDLLGWHPFAQQGGAHHATAQRTGAPIAPPGR